jgi:hypothetical protein
MTEQPPAASVPTASLALARQLPPTAPEWIIYASTMLDSELFGDRWAELVTLWKAFEISHQFTGSLRLATSNRPSCIGQWIQRARSSSYRPAIVNLEQFASNFLNWWTGVQPKWRISTEGSTLRRTRGDLVILRLSGPNGLVSILVALFFWCVASDANESSKTMWMRHGKQEWEDAMEDVLWVFKELVKQNG